MLFTAINSNIFFARFTQHIEVREGTFTRPGNGFHVFLMAPTTTQLLAAPKTAILTA